MAIRQDIPKILDHIKRNKVFLRHNHELFDIFDGNLKHYIKKDLEKQMKPENLNMMMHRISPINLLQRVISKVSKIYNKAPHRELSSQSPADEDLFSFYVDEMDFNVRMDEANEFFNLFKGMAFEPFVHNGFPRLRVWPYDRFLFFSDDMVDPTTPTHFIRFAGDMTAHMDVTGSKAKDEIYFVYTADEFLIIDGEGSIKQRLMEAEGNAEGINPIGALPAVYVNRSKIKITPTPDSDMLSMVKLFPILISDLNFAVMFQSFSMLYGIDVDMENIEWTPNAILNLKSTDIDGDGKPEIGIVKPEVDTDKVINLIATELSMWLQSRDIRPGSVGDLSAEGFSSGISKIVDEMDTFENRQKQVPFFVAAETQFWDLVFNRFHPFWRATGQINTSLNFSPGLSVSIQFPAQQPIMNRIDVITEQAAELDNKFTTRFRALSRLNPDMTPEQIEELMKEIDEESAEARDRMVQAFGSQGQPQEDESEEGSDDQPQEEQSEE